MHAAKPLAVIVADDNREFADSIAALLRIWGHEALVAYGGAGALALARDRCPDVALVDLSMPDMDGLEVARTLRADPATASARLWTLSGHGTEADVARSLAAGFDLHLVKPVPLDRLRSLLAGIAKGTE